MKAAITEPPRWSDIVAASGYIKLIGFGAFRSGRLSCKTFIVISKRAGTLFGRTTGAPFSPVISFVAAVDTQPGLVPPMP